MVKTLTTHFMFRPISSCKAVRSVPIIGGGHLNTLLNYPSANRTAIITINTNDSLKSLIHKALKQRKLFPTDASAKKIVYLVIQNAANKCSNTHQKLALNRLMFIVCKIVFKLGSYTELFTASITIPHDPA